MRAQRISVLTIAFVIIASAAYAEPQVSLSTDDQAVNASCAADAKLSECDKQQAGHGLVKCMNAYKQANPSFNFSSVCMSAIQKRDAHKKANN